MCVWDAFDLAMIPWRLFCSSTYIGCFSAILAAAVGLPVYVVFLCPCFIGRTLVSPTNQAKFPLARTYDTSRRRRSCLGSLAAETCMDVCASRCGAHLMRATCVATELLA